MDTTQPGSGANPLLRKLLDEADLSKGALARAVVAAGAEQGHHVGTNTTSVTRMLAGAQPHWPVPRLVARALSQQLHREVSVTDCGFADQTPAEEDPHDGLHCSGTLEQTVRTVVEMSGRDMNRRRFLLGSAFTSAAFAEPALFALTIPPSPSAARSTGPRIGMPDVEIITETVAHLRRLDHRYGSGRVRQQIIALLNREAGTVLHGSYSDKTGKALLGAVAQAAWLAGATSADVGRHALAQRYYIQTLNLAMSAGDRLYAANVLSHMSRMAVQIGHATAKDRHRVGHARQAVALARTGQQLAGRAATPALTALMSAVEARGLVLLGDGEATAIRRAIRAAEQSYDRVRPETEPTWLSFYTEAELAADVGRCLSALGESEQAIHHIGHALAQYEPWRTRSRCFVQIDLSAAHLVGRDHEQAAAYGRDAVRTATHVSSQRSHDKLATLRRNLGPHTGGSPELADLDQRITRLLPTASRNEDTVSR
ncbi:hypothetical protein [Nocardia sp. BMG51109]|uniref:hypothetical protein n=1 Tax=Nocardia sp. BMG51109 TaxID=1056816 RepID=UPI000464B2DC|nr:hypothetical protein [Nocardia sp. BMG51109]